MRYQMTVTIDDDAEAEIDFTVSKGVPETGPSYACGGTPAEPPMVEDVTVLTIDGEKPDADRAAVWEAYIRKNHEGDLFEHAARHSDDGPDPDDARDRAFDDELHGFKD